MGMYASYYAIDDSQAKEYKALLSNNNDGSVEEFFENLEERDDKIDDEDFANLDKLWDGLYFLLTGFNSDDDYNDKKSDEQLALYRGFFGVDTLSDEGVYLLDADKVADVVNALNKVDINELIKQADFAKFEEADIYPSIWDDEDEWDEIGEELAEYFEKFKQFYQNALKNNRSVLIVIC